MKKVPPFIVLLVLLCAVSFGQVASLRKLKKQLPYIHDSLKYVDALNRLAMLSYESSLDSTFYYTKQARSIADRLQYAAGRADATNNLGIVYDMSGNLQLALRYYNDAYNRYLALHDTANVVQTTMNIAMVYQEIGKDSKAVINFKKAVSLGKKLKRDSIMSLVLYNYALQYPDSIKEDSVLIYIGRARHIALKYHDERVLLAVNQLTGDYYIRHNQRDKGITLLQQSANNAIRDNLYYFSLDILIELGDLYALTDSVKALGYYKQGLDITTQKGYRVYTKTITKKLYDFYVAKKDNKAAFFYSRQLLSFQDEQDKIDNNSGIDYIQYAIKDQQLESAHVQSKYQQIFLWLAVLVCILAIVILLILWRNWQQMRKTAQALRMQFSQSESTMEALEVMNKDYARLIKIVAHDLRNPIGGISAITALMQSSGTLHGEMEEMMSLVQLSSQNCLELINELLKTDFDQQQKFKHEQINIDELLQQCIRLLAFRAADKNQQLLLNSNLEITISGDNEKLWRVMNNLIVNAIKFSPNGSEIQVSTQRIQNDVVIMVKDTGMGIPLNMQNKIFDPFTSAKRSGTGGEQAFGLGLYISKQIIEAHNGKLWFESEDGKGTIFYIELPISEAVKQSVL